MVVPRVVIVAAALVFAIVGTARATEWSPPRTVVKGHIDSVSATARPDGGLMLLWKRWRGRSSRVLTRDLHPDGRPGRVSQIRLGRRAEVLHGIDVATNGAVFACGADTSADGDGPIYAFLRPAGSHRWMATRLSSGREPYLETCQATSDGGGVVTWLERSTAVNVAIVDPRGDVVLEQTLYDSGLERGGVTAPKLGVAPDGRAIVLWGEGYDVEDRAGPLLVAERLPGGAFGPPARIDPSELAGDATLTIDDTGVATIAWTRGREIRVRSGAVGGQHTETVLAGPDPFDQGLTSAANGNTLLTGVATTPRSSMLAATIRAPGGTFGPARTLTPVRRGVEPAAAIADSGRAVVAWSQGKEARRGRLRATVIEPGGLPGPPRMLHRPMIPEGGYTIGLQATASRSRIFVTWLADGCIRSGCPDRFLVSHLAIG